jgi:RNA polymerase sigma-70 factor (ECF subfamily)
MSFAITWTLDQVFASVRLASFDRTIHDAPKKDPALDRELLERVKNGDRRASSQLFRRHANDVYRRLTRLVGPDSEREDLVQEVFIAAFRGLQRFRGDASFATWLYKVAVNIAYRHLRRRKPRALDFDTALDQAIDPGLSPEAETERRQQVKRALLLLEKLSAKKRIAFVLREVEQLSLAEIAELVDSTPAAVGQRVKHAQLELEVLLAREQKRTKEGTR